ncbi:MAG: hypothetical protein NVSMB19_07810 [Vulcanimicrobiaceae bacterium]
MTGESEAESLPQVRLTRAQIVRLSVIAAFVLFAVARVVPDGIRLFSPLGVFGYITDSNGVVVRLSGRQVAGSDRVMVGDRVRIDRIKPFDRKPGFVGLGFSYDNRTRYLPIERAGRERVLRLVAHDESLTNRITTVLRILIFIVVVCFGALLFAIQPSLATGAIFAYTLGGEFPTTYGDLIVPNPWRQIPEWIAATLSGGSRSALAIFATSLFVADPRLRRWIAIGGAFGAVGLGTLHAFGFHQLVYEGTPTQSLDDLYAHLSSFITAFTIFAFAGAFARARGRERQRIGWIAAAFALASVARLAADAFYPAKIPPWANGTLLTIAVLPIIVVWIAVVRDRLFNVDFVVSRAVVYVALTAGVIGTIAIVEEVGTLIFYYQSDLSYGFLVAISIVIGAFTGRLRKPIEKFVDRFIFRERRAQRKALELIAGYILDAETVEDVYRALLEDATHALGLSFAGILVRNVDGGFSLDRGYGWPVECVVRLKPTDGLIAAIARSRSALTFSGKETTLIERALPGERLTFAAPLFFDRSVTAIVVYGRNVSGLDLDPEEREQLVRVVAHASIALGAIELAKLRALARTASPAPAG